MGTRKIWNCQHSEGKTGEGCQKLQGERQKGRTLLKLYKILGDSGKYMNHVQFSSIPPGWHFPVSGYSQREI